jgi:hypothetical protein
MNGKNTNANTLTYKCSLHLKTQEHGRLKLKAGTAPTVATAPKGRVPRISRLMALAIRFQGLLDRGEVKDYAELARLGHVTRARVTQIMNLLNLAPSIQEALLFLPAVTGGRDPVKEWQVRPIAADADWERQRGNWRRLSSSESPRLPGRAT